jgi:hypothetical protein
MPGATGWVFCAKYGVLGNFAMPKATTWEVAENPTLAADQTSCTFIAEKVACKTKGSHLEYEFGCSENDHEASQRQH